ncbi:MAG: crossover junction endodeoxyribonuclease RuvC [bacterium]|nr:crossover junction endodeoxyribonuclease RuvC [bacterium]
MRVFGVDPGSLKSGYGIVDKIQGELVPIEFGVIRTNPKAQLAQRLLQISTRLQELIQQYQPDEFAVENVFVAKNAKSSLKLGQARGAILLTAAQAGLQVDEYTPLEVKQSVVGYGRADKSQVQQMVKVLLKLQELPQPDDAADALAIAICHHHSMKMRDQLKGMLTR